MTKAGRALMGLTAALGIVLRLWTYRAPELPPERESTPAEKSGMYFEPAPEPEVLTARGLGFRNKTDYAPDLEELINRRIDFAPGDKVLIIHSHTTEAYAMGDYEPTDPYRTLDREKNVIRVGEEAAEVLRQMGIEVIHDETLYDYPSYSKSYENAAVGIKKALAADGKIKAVLDLHRDALEDQNGNALKTSGTAFGQQCAGVAIICGSDASGLSHPGWQNNLGFGLRLQRAMADQFPGLERDLVLSRYRYNTHLTELSVIVEVGSHGNTLEEAIVAVRAFARCYGEVLTGTTRFSQPENR